jgi:hypothetical protein
MGKIQNQTVCLQYRGGPGFAGHGSRASVNHNLSSSFDFRSFSLCCVLFLEHFALLLHFIPGKFRSAAGRTMKSLGFITIRFLATGGVTIG